MSGILSNVKHYRQYVMHNNRYFDIMSCIITYTLVSDNKSVLNLYLNIQNFQLKVHIKTLACKHNIKTTCLIV